MQFSSSITVFQLEEEQQQQEAMDQQYKVTEVLSAKPVKGFIHMKEAVKYSAQDHLRVLGERSKLIKVKHRFTLMLIQMEIRTRIVKYNIRCQHIIFTLVD